MKKNSGDIIAKAIMLLTGAAYGVMTVLSSDFETLMEKGIGSFALFLRRQCFWLGLPPLSKP